MRVTKSATIVLIAALCAVGCAASARQETISHSSMALNAARDGALAYNAKHEDEIAHSGPQTHDGALAAQSSLAAYRVKRAKFDAAMAVAYDALVIAIRVNDDQSLAALKAALPAAIDAYLTLKGVP